MKFLVFCFTILSTGIALAGDGHDHGENKFASSAFASSFDLSSQAIKNLDIKSVVVKNDIFKKSMELPCIIKNPPEQTSQIHTTYIGEIKKIYVRVGDRVKKGQLLYSIFSMKAVRDMPVVSPIDGIISAQNVSIGQIVQLETVLMEITSTEKFVAEGFAYLSDDINHIHKGDFAEIQIDGTHENIIGLVERFSPQVNPQTKTKSLFVDFSSSDEHIYPNMHCKMYIYYGSEKQAIAVPSSAVLDDNGKKFVFLRNKNHFEKISVVTGQKSGDTLEIKEGVHEGDEIVYQGNYQLQFISADEMGNHDHDEHQHEENQPHNEDDFEHSEDETHAEEETHSDEDGHNH